MTILDLGRQLGDVSSAAFQRQYQHELLQSLEHQETVTFHIVKHTPAQTSPDTVVKPRAHTAGTNCLTIDGQQGRFIASGGADSAVRLWDLESQSTHGPASTDSTTTYYPAATLARSVKDAHTHALTSISVYPFDPVATTLLTTSHDKTLLLSQITPTNLQPLHKFNLDFTPYTHTISSIPSATPLVAIGTAHPAVRLLDLRSGLSTHSLPGHNGAIYALQFSPSHEHILISGGTDGRIIIFDIRRANPAFASLDLDDTVGFTSNPAECRPINLHLNFNAQAHTGPITGLSIPASDATKLVSAGHDQRIRVWDLNTGRNELVHFGPRIRNSRVGNLTPLLSPVGMGKAGRETLFWPNDDGRGEITVHSMREGNLLRVMRSKGIDRSNVTKSKVEKLTSGGRINALALRVNADAGDGLEMYSAHGDGRICVWTPNVHDDQDEEEEVDKGGGPEHDDDVGDRPGIDNALDASQMQRKRKRDLIGDLVEGLTKRPITFS